MAAWVGKFYEKTAIENLKQRLVLYNLAKKYYIPQGISNYIRMYRTETLSAADTTAVTEGYPLTAATAMSATSVSCTLSEYANFVMISEFLTKTAITPVVEQAVAELSYKAARSIDSLLKTTIDAITSTQIIFPSTVTATTDISDTTVLDGAVIRKAVRMLQNAAVDYHPMTPGLYAGVVNPYTAYDLQSVSTAGNWLTNRQYDRSREIDQYRIGDLLGVRFYWTQNYTTSASTKTVYYNYVFGNEAFGAVGLGGEGNPFQIIIKETGTAGTGDPANQIGSVAYKFRFASTLLNNPATVLIKSGATQ
jgi:N4-gp56 family major capsid protein